MQTSPFTGTALRGEVARRPYRSVPVFRAPRGTRVVAGPSSRHKHRGFGPSSYAFARRTPQFQLLFSSGGRAWPDVQKQHGLQKKIQKGIEK